MATDNPSPILFLLSAPSGGGKTTVCKRLLKDNPSLTRIVTCTTRPMRQGEQDGIDYHFLDSETFLRRVQAGDFLEHASVYGYSYGTLKSEVLEKLRTGKDVLLTVDVQGEAAIRQQAQEDGELKRALVTVFLTPPSLAVLEERLRRRGTDSEAAMRKRLDVAKHEIAHWPNFDYLVLSTTMQEDLGRMQIIIEAEKMRQSRAPHPVCE